MNLIYLLALGALASAATANGVLISPISLPTAEAAPLTSSTANTLPPTFAFLGAGALLLFLMLRHR